MLLTLNWSRRCARRWLTSVAFLEENNIALDAPWGEVQFIERSGERIPLPGGSGSMLFNVISAGFVEGEGYSDVRAGNSYIHAVSWDENRLS